MSKQKPKSAKKAPLSRMSNRTLKGKRKSIAPVAPTAAAEGKATETTEVHARASGFLPVIPTHAISAESLDVIPYLTEEDIAAASGELSPQERQAIEEILRQPNPVELPKTTSPRKKGKSGPAYDIVEEGDEKLVDYGPYLLKQEANGEISFFRTDGMVVIEGIPIVGRDSAEVATIREALRVYRDPNQSAAWRATALRLLQVWSFLEKAERSWSETSYYRYSDAYVMRPCSETLPLSGVLTDGSKALFPIELLTKLAKWCGALFERFRRHPEDRLALVGKRQRRGASRGGVKHKEEHSIIWKNRLEKIQLGIQDAFGTLPEIARKIAEGELKREKKFTTVTAITRRAEYILEGLRKKYPAEMAKCHAECASQQS